MAAAAVELHREHAVVQVKRALGVLLYRILGAIAKDYRFYGWDKFRFARAYLDAVVHLADPCNKFLRVPSTHAGGFVVVRAATAADVTPRGLPVAVVEFPLVVLLKTKETLQVRRYADHAANLDELAAMEEQLGIELQAAGSNGGSGTVIAAASGVSGLGTGRAATAREAGAGGGNVAAAARPALAPQPGAGGINAAAAGCRDGADVPGGAFAQQWAQPVAMGTPSASAGELDAAAVGGVGAGMDEAGTDEAGLEGVLDWLWDEDAWTEPQRGEEQHQHEEEGGEQGSGWRPCGEEPADICAVQQGGSGASVAVLNPLFLKVPGRGARQFALLSLAKRARKLMVMFLPLLDCEVRHLVDGLGERELTGADKRGLTFRTNGYAENKFKIVKGAGYLGSVRRRMDAYICEERVLDCREVEVLVSNWKQVTAPTQVPRHILTMATRARSERARLQTDDALPLILDHVLAATMDDAIVSLVQLVPQQLRSFALDSAELRSQMSSLALEQPTAEAAGALQRAGSAGVTVGLGEGAQQERVEQVVEELEQWSRGGKRKASAREESADDLPSHAPHQGHRGSSRPPAAAAAVAFTCPRCGKQGNKNCKPKSGAAEVTGGYCVACCRAMRAVHGYPTCTVGAHAKQHLPLARAHSAGSAVSGVLGDAITVQGQLHLQRTGSAGSSSMREGGAGSAVQRTQSAPGELDHPGLLPVAVDRLLHGANEQQPLASPSAIRGAKRHAAVGQGVVHSG